MKAIVSMALALLLLTVGAKAQSDFQDIYKPQCVACHGDDGVSSIEETPHLGGIDDYYALLQLVAFREGNRKSDVMNEIVAEMSNDDLRAAAAWIDGLPRPPVPEEEVDAAKMEEGAALAKEHRCVGCHGADLLGGRQMPPLKNQREDYLLKALLDFKAERRLGDRAAMVEIVTPLDEEQLATLAYYLHHLE